MTDPWRLDGQVALVTGGTQGIGRGVVDALAERGAEVWLAARTAADVDAVVAEVAATGAVVHGLVADLAMPEGRAAVVDAMTTRGRLDVLVNNVGRNLRKPTLDWTLDDLHAVFGTNVDSAWGLTVALHDLLADGGGSVVVVTSVAGHRAVRTSTAGYAATKGALDSLVRFLAAEWGPHGIRVNAVAPWYVRTPLAEQVLKDPAKTAAILERTPLGRVGEPEDIGRAVAFLAMPASSWVTGAIVPVDGGFETLGV